VFGKRFQDQNSLLLLRKNFLLQQDIPGVASRKAQEYLNAIVGDYNHADADLFTKAIILNDAVETVKVARKLSPDESVKLGFGLEESSVGKYRDLIFDELKKHPEIKKDLDLYYKVSEDIRQRTIDAATELDPALGRYYEQKLHRDKYYHHMILKHVEQDYKRTAGGKRP